MTGQDLVSELQQRKTVLEVKCKARERLSLLFDNGYFIEVDAFFGDGTKPCEGVISGYGSIEGRLMYAYAQDSSVLHGAIGAIHAEKICRVMDLALKTGAPIVSIVDSGGARIDEGIDSMMAVGKIMNKTVELSGIVPQLTVITGTCCGGLAISAQCTDFVFATKESVMFVNGPQVILGETGEKVNLDAEENAKNAGNVHFVCDDDASCIHNAKLLLSYLPSNNLEDAQSQPTLDDINRPISGDAGTIINEIADDGQVIEINSHYAKSVITAFARLNSYTVGIVANDGLLCNYSAKKAARFISFCNSFGIPLVSLIDVSGFAIGAKYEHDGLAQSAAKLTVAYADACVPKVSLVIGNAYGSAYLAMNAGADFVLAWPQAQISSMRPDGAAVILHNEAIAKSDDPIKAREEMTEDYLKTIASPYTAASKGYVDDVIEPSQTRQRVISALDMLATKHQIKPGKVRGTISFL